MFDFDRMTDFAKVCAILALVLLGYRYFVNTDLAYNSEYQFLIFGLMLCSIFLKHPEKEDKPKEEDKTDK